MFVYRIDKFVFFIELCDETLGAKAYEKIGYRFTLLITSKRGPPYCDANSTNVLAKVRPFLVKNVHLTLINRLTVFLK